MTEDSQWLGQARGVDMESLLPSWWCTEVETGRKPVLRQGLEKDGSVITDTGDFLMDLDIGVIRQTFILISLFSALLIGKLFIF